MVSVDTIVQWIRGHAYANIEVQAGPPPTQGEIMNSQFDLRITRMLFAAGLALGAVAVQAASGVAVSRYQETGVKLGMTPAEVQQILGRPAQVFNYRGAPGPSWNYYVVDGRYGNTQFGVDFGSDGTVVSAREFAIPNGA